MQFLDLARYRFHGADFGADGAADAAFGIDLGFFASANQEIEYRFGGAHSGAETAIYALLIVDVGEIVFDSDGVYRAFAGAYATADAGMETSTDLFGVSAFVFGRALYIDVALERHEIDQGSRAGFHTSSTSRAFLEIDQAHAIAIDRDGVEFAGAHTVVQAHTSPRTGVWSTGDIGSSLAGSDSLIVIFPIGIFISATGAVDHGDLAIRATGLHVHDLGDLGDDIGSAGGAFVDGFSAFDDLFGISGATRFATGTAICSGKHVYDLFHAGIDLHGKDL